MNETNIVDQTLNNKENHIFLLGAGFSKALHSSMPTTKELMLKVHDRIIKIKASEGIIRQLNWSKVFDETSNFEIELSILSDPPLWVLEEDRGLASWLFKEIKKAITEIIFEAQKGFNAKDTAITKLLEFWWKNEADVLTLNYDTIIEEAYIQNHEDLKKGNGNQCNTRGDHRELYPFLIFDAHGNKAGTTASFDLLKLHGSLQWFGSAGFEPIDVNIASEHTCCILDENEDEYSHLCDHSLCSDQLMIPPIINKTSSNQHSLYERIWRDSKKAVDKATHIWIIGYSFPEEDFAVSTLFRNLTSTVKVSYFSHTADNENKISLLERKRSEQEILKTLHSIKPTIINTPDTLRVLNEHLSGF